MEVSRLGTRGIQRREMDAWRSIVLVVLASILLMSCSNLSLGGTLAGNTSTTNDVALAKLHWCGKVLMTFRNEGALTGTPSATSTAGTAGTPGASSPPTAGATASTLTNWEQVKENLGFTVYLPATLPDGSCLVSAYGMVHDPILGGSFTIGYLLPDHSALSLSEAPVSAGASTPFQCSVTSSTSSTTPTAAAAGKGGTPVATNGTTQLPLQVCTGARATTSIVFSARGTTAKLQQFFNVLQPDVTWIPARS